MRIQGCTRAYFSGYASLGRSMCWLCATSKKVRKKTNHSTYHLNGLLDGCLIIIVLHLQLVTMIKSTIVISLGKSRRLYLCVLSSKYTEVQPSLTFPGYHPDYSTVLPLLSVCLLDTKCVFLKIVTSSSRACSLRFAIRKKSPICAFSWEKMDGLSKVSRLHRGQENTALHL